MVRCHLEFLKQRKIPTTPINKLYIPKHKESDACANITTDNNKWLQSVHIVVNSVKLHLTSYNSEHP